MTDPDQRRANLLRGTLLALALSVVTLSAAPRTMPRLQGSTASSRGPTPPPLALQQAPSDDTSGSFFGVDPKWLIANGGLLLALYVVIRLLNAEKQQAKDERVEMSKERGEIKQILKDSAAANHAHALAVARNTDAIAVNTKSNEALSAEVRKLSERRVGERE